VKPRLDIVIAGAGIAGMAMAALLAARPQPRRLRVTLVDAGAPPEFALTDDVGLRVSAISAGSMRLLDSLGIRQSLLDARAGPYRDMRVWDSRGSCDDAEALRFEAADMALPELGFIVENNLIRHCLLARLQESRATLHFNRPIRRIQCADDGGYAITLDNGDTLQAALLIGADGATSGVRDAAGIGVDRWHYQQAAVVTHAVPAREHRETAWQRFLPGGPVALLPLADGRVSVVWSTSVEHAATLVDITDEAFSRALTEASDYALGELSVSAPRASFPLRAQHAERYVGRGVALIGDAAHTVHPLAGQGANLGLADAARLQSVISTAVDAAEYPGDIPVLRRYERAQRGANRTMLHFIDALNRLYAVDRPLIARLRGRGMQLFNLNGPVRRYAMRVALGINAVSHAE